MSAANCHCTNDDRGHLATPAWRNALAGLASPFFRLHHLRNIRSRMLEEALSDLDRCKPRRPDA
jgi:hypothetical protein